jgi:LacI family transcriptional regulator
MSLAGFDDIPVVREVSPPLTTVALSLTEMGEQVIVLALRTPSGAGRSRLLRIGGNLILRGSAGAPPGC